MYMYMHLFQCSCLAFLWWCSTISFIVCITSRGWHHQSELKFMLISFNLWGLGFAYCYWLKLIVCVGGTTSSQNPGENTDLVYTVVHTCIQYSCICWLFWCIHATYCGLTRYWLIISQFLSKALSVMIFMVVAVWDQWVQVPITVALYPHRRDDLVWPLMTRG